MDKHQLLQAVKDELKRKGLSAAEASERAVGNKALIANMGRDRYGMPSTEHLQALCDVLGWEFYVGPPRETGPINQVMVNSSEFVNIPLHEALLAAGTGAENLSEEIVDYLAFRRDWMRKIGTSPSNAVLARGFGDSMLPTIWDGDLVMIDRAKKDVPVRKLDPNSRHRLPIYAFLDDGAARMKRLERPEPDRVVLVSDNPDYPPQLAKIETLKIIGKVVWWAHTANE